MWYGKHFVFGCQPIKPITNIPPGAKVRVRMRNDKMTYAFVKIGNEVIQYYIEIMKDGTWQLFDTGKGRNSTL